MKNMKRPQIIAARETFYRTDNGPGINSFVEVRLQDGTVIDANVYGGRHQGFDAGVMDFLRSLPAGSDPERFSGITPENAPAPGGAGLIQGEPGPWVECP